MSLMNFLLKRKVSRDRRVIQDALALHHRGEARHDGLTLTQVSHHLEIEWRPRDGHPWDCASEPTGLHFLLAEQSREDREAALPRLFNDLPELDVIDFAVTHPD